MPFLPGQRVLHAEYGEGIVVSSPTEGFVQVFFGTSERRVSINSVSSTYSRSEQIIRFVSSGITRAQRAWLVYEAFRLPLIESVVALTSAKIDLLPHQVVLTHRISTASPRRFLIADEVGLGKTIETALVLRELASRGELKRALIIVPAGLVNNWHRELNEIFGLNFEIFGNEGDVTDRRSNAFLKHDRLIASVDTLKRRSRIKHLQDAPLWDLVVFDEAHHLAAYRSGGRVRKTENYKLAEVMRDLSRDLILLSATPHQGDNYRFWMLIRLLNPTLFSNLDDMMENRHRLNEVIFRRTKADACRPDGGTLFARRFVHTESFIMSTGEREFYGELVEYLADGFALAHREGGRGRALGFVMTIFQKIAASSFAAVRRTLRRRLLALTIQEGIMHDNNLDIEAREISYGEAREIIRVEYNLGEDRLSTLEIDHIMNDFKRRILMRMSEEGLLGANEDIESELSAASYEDAVMSAIQYALPEERTRIKQLLSTFPVAQETKVKKLLNALGTLWRSNPDEKIVIFATYLGTVEMLAEEIERVYPGQGVVVLKGGDHGAKLAAEKKFRRPMGPKVLISTAAGREGINMQFARILFNFDLPWNPMDVEQRIGRIHRYGQQHTAQVYNLVLSDTIEGKIYLLLDEKLKEIAKTLGKLDEHGNVAEDLQSQILGQLSEHVNYENLYKNALDDLELRRTKYELEIAMTNSIEARKAVFELFQDLDGFSLDDYKPFSNVDDGLDAIVKFLRKAVQIQDGQFSIISDKVFSITTPKSSVIKLTTNRDLSLEDENLELLGIDHWLVADYITQFRQVDPSEIGIQVQGTEGIDGAVSIWYVEVQGKRKENKSYIVPLSTTTGGNRVPHWERNIGKLYTLPPFQGINERFDRKRVLSEVFEPMLQRDLVYRGIISESRDFTSKLVGWIDIMGNF